MIDKANYLYFRKAWDRKAAFHLTRVRSIKVHWTDRLASYIWLAGEKIPLTGFAPSMNFKGLPFRS